MITTTAMTFTRDETLTILVCIRERRDRLANLIDIEMLKDPKSVPEDDPLRKIVAACNSVITKLGSEL